MISILQTFLQVALVVWDYHISCILILCLKTWMISKRLTLKTRRGWRWHDLISVEWPPAPKDGPVEYVDFRRRRRHILLRMPTCKTNSASCSMEISQNYHQPVKKVKKEARLCFKYSYCHFIYLFIKYCYGPDEWEDYWDWPTSPPEKDVTTETWF